MPYVTVSYKPKRAHFDPEKDAQISTAAGCEPVKRHILHPSTPDGKIECLAITKFAYTTAEERTALMEALTPLGDTRDMGGE